MHLLQGAVILATCGCFTNHVGAYVLPHEEGPFLPAPIHPTLPPDAQGIPTPFQMDHTQETGAPSVASPIPPEEICCTPPPPKAVCCTPGCGTCSTESCVSEFCSDIPFSSCCGESFLAESQFFDGNMTKVDVTYAELGRYLAKINGDLDGGDKVN